MWEHGFSEGDDSLLDTWDGTLKEDKVVLDLTIADEATHSVALLALALREQYWVTYGVIVLFTMS